MSEKKKVLVVRNLAPENAWFGDICEEISREFKAHGRGFLIVPFTHEDEIDKEKPQRTLLATDLEPAVFMAAISGAILDYCTTYYKIFTGRKMRASKMAKLIRDNLKALEEGK